MYYKKRREFPALPLDIKQECISFAEENLKNNVPTNVWYQRVETEDKASLSYTQDLSTGSGGVGFYTLPADLTNRIVEYYKEYTELPTTNPIYFVQVVAGGNYVAPHADNPSERSTGLIYLLKAGGDNVRTKWYKVKDEYSNLSITYNTGIPYSKLIEVEDNHLEEDCWHWMNFTEIHSVENQSSLRLALWGLEL